MSMDKRKREQQPPLVIVAEDLPPQGGHPFCQRENKMLTECEFIISALMQKGLLKGKTMGAVQGCAWPRAVRMGDLRSDQTSLDAIPGHSRCLSARSQTPDAILLGLKKG